MILKKIITAYSDISMTLKHALVIF